MKLDYIKQWFCNIFFQKISFKLFLPLLVHPHRTSLLFLFHFLFKYFSSCLYVVKIFWTRKLCPVRLAHLVTRLELKCNSFSISTRVATSNYSKSVSIFRNDFRLLEMNSAHSKTVFTLLALWPLPIKFDVFRFLEKWTRIRI